MPSSRGPLWTTQNDSAAHTSGGAATRAYLASCPLPRHMSKIAGALSSTSKRNTETSTVAIQVCACLSSTPSRPLSIPPSCPLSSLLSFPLLSTSARPDLAFDAPMSSLSAELAPGTETGRGGGIQGAMWDSRTPVDFLFAL